jgi:hypothetical protein
MPCSTKPEAPGARCQLGRTPAGQRPDSYRASAPSGSPRGWVPVGEGTAQGFEAILTTSGTHLCYRPAASFHVEVASDWKSAHGGTRGSVHGVARLVRLRVDVGWPRVGLSVGCPADVLSTGNARVWRGVWWERQVGAV